MQCHWFPFYFLIFLGTRQPYWPMSVCGLWMRSSQECGSSRFMHGNSPFQTWSENQEGIYRYSKSLNQIYHIKIFWNKAIIKYSRKFCITIISQHIVHKADINILLLLLQRYSAGSISQDVVLRNKLSSSWSRCWVEALPWRPPVK